MEAGNDGEARERSEEQEPGLEARLRRLDEIVSALEADELELERALALFEEGVAHVRSAEKILAAAELRVEELLGDGGEGRTRPFEDQDG
ncbi:MAG: exodeoxyribonuclease VII small subunit [Gemmatimonadota bacterium]|jgi:exodeoxyribonuclease VII small subunit